MDNRLLRDANTDGDAQTGALGQPGSGLDERLYALHDANFNVTALVDPSGTVLERYTYTAYGTVEIRTAAFQPTGNPTAYAWPYTYTSRRLDSETGLMYYRNRMYHPELGRFVSRDPIGYAAGDVSLCRYVGNSAVTRADPSGEISPQMLGCITGGLAGALGTVAYDWWHDDLCTCRTTISAFLNAALGCASGAILTSIPTASVYLITKGAQTVNVLRPYLRRVLYVVILWTAAGVGSWWFGRGVGAAGVFLGLFSGADLYWSIEGHLRRVSLMLTLATCGFAGGLAYEWLVSLPVPQSMPVRIVFFGIIIGCVFGVLSRGVGWAFGGYTAGSFREEAEQR